MLNTWIYKLISLKANRLIFTNTIFESVCQIRGDALQELIYLTFQIIHIINDVLSRFMQLCFFNFRQQRVDLGFYLASLLPKFADKNIVFS